MSEPIKYTLIIPTYCRHDRISVLNDYYSNFEHCTVIIADSSPTPFTCKLSDSLTYLHLPDMTYTQKMHHVLQQIPTAFTVMCADDDFLIESSLQPILQAMDRDQTYQMGVGNLLYYTAPFDGFFLPKPAKKNPFKSELDYALSYPANFQWGCFRTPLLSECFSILDSQEISNRQYIISVLLSLIFIHGKIFFSELPCLVRFAKKKNFLGWLHTRIFIPYLSRSVKEEELEKLSAFFQETYHTDIFERITEKRYRTYLKRHFFGTAYFHRKYLFENSAPFVRIAQIIDAFEKRFQTSPDPVRTANNEKVSETILVIVDPLRIPGILDVLKIIAEQAQIIIVIRPRKLYEKSHEGEKNYNLLHTIPNTQIMDIPPRLGNTHIKLKAFLYGFRIFGIRPFHDLMMMTKYTSLGQWLYEKDWIRTLRYEQTVFTRLIDQYNIRCTLSMTDKNIPYHQPALWLAAKNRNIPIMLPVMYHHGPFITGIKHNLKYQLWAFASLYQRYVYKRLTRIYPHHNYKNYFFYQAYILNAFEKLNIHSTNPWIIGTGPATHVICENLHTANRYITWGTPPEKITIVGDVSYDSLFESQQNASVNPHLLHQKYGFDTSKKLLILALPNAMEHGMLSRDDHFEKLDFIISTLAQTGYALLLSLHPSMDRLNYVHYEEEYACRISDERLKEILPFAHLFVASFSNTITWAIMMKIPSVVLDFYGLDYPIYDQFRSVTVLKDEDKLLASIQEISADKIDFTEDVEAFSVDTVFDGKVTQRTADFIISTMREEKKAYA